MRNQLLWCTVMAALTSCAGVLTPVDNRGDGGSAADSGQTSDAGSADSGTAGLDAGRPADSGTPTNDAGPGPNDAGPSPGVPSWVPSTAWRWTDIPHSTFTTSIKNDGSGVAPATGAEPSGATYASYTKETSFGGPSYSRKHQELYLFGGGHAATTLNALIRWNLGKETPDLEVVVPATTADLRATSFFDPTNRAKGYWPDGKPKAAHMYHALQYLDATDELLAVGLAFGHDPVTDERSWNTVAAYHRGDASWLPEGTYPALPDEPYQNSGLLIDAPTFASWDGAAVYYYRDGGGSGPWRKVNSATRAVDEVGGSLSWWLTTVGAARDDRAEALLVGGQTGGGGSGYQFRTLSLTTGALTPLAATGFAFPTDCGIKDLVWVSKHRYWVAWCTDTVSDNAGIGVQRVLKFEPTSPTQITATDLSLSGTAPAGTGGCKQGLFYDDTFDALLFVGNLDEPLKIVKVD